MGNQTARNLIKTTEAIEKNFGVKFCTQCNKTRPVEGGKIYTLSNGRTRWKCAVCVKKLRPSGFTKK